jgi:hypothetical protein
LSRRDTSVTTDIWLCAVCVYAGFELCSITEIGDGKCQYRIQCPQLDFEDLETSYRENSLPLEDAKSFVHAFNTIQKTQKDYRRRGMSGWSSQRFQDGAIG